MLLTTLYETYLRLAVARILKVACEEMKNVRAAESDSNCMEGKEWRGVCGNSGRIANVPLWVPSVQKLYLALWEEYFLKSMTRQTRPAPDCFAASSRPDQRSFETLESFGVYRVKVESRSTENGTQIRKES